jgi:HEAT repeat protein
MESIPELIHKLGHSDDYFERQKAAWALVKIGDEAIDPLVEALEAGEFSDLRYKAAWALGKIGNSRAVEPLSKALLSDPDYVVREWCAAALEAIVDPTAVPHLVQAIKKDGSKDVRLRAFMALRGIGASEAFMDLLSASDPENRGMAITGLAKLKRQDAVDKIASFCDNEDIEVRRRCAAFMGEFCSPEALQCLVKSLKDSQPAVRTEALKSLGRIKGEQACHLALCSLEDEDSVVRLNAVTALGEIGNNFALDRLVEVMFGQDKPEIRAWAAWSLGEIGDERAVEHLIKAYKTCPMEVMKKAKASLEEVFKISP